ncbi:MAG: hemerythrin domain-containing protein [Burkholderiales bacterium]|nr:hemerythrin domain-containing protein [Burkholderiales bacterium]
MTDPVAMPAAPAAPEPVAVWHAEHRNFARLLDLVERELAVFHSGERPDYELLLDVVTYLRHFPDLAHHPREDVAFARLVDRDPALAPLVTRLHQEHRVIAAAGERLRELLEGVLADGSFVGRAELEAACATFLVYYRQHIQTEERDILPRAARLLDDGDWKAVADAHAGAPDPLFGGAVADRYRELRRKIAVEAGP